MLRLKIVLVLSIILSGTILVSSEKENASVIASTSAPVNTTEKAAQNQTETSNETTRHQLPGTQVVSTVAPEKQVEKTASPKDSPGKNDTAVATEAPKKEAKDTSTKDKNTKTDVKGVTATSTTTVTPHDTVTTPTPQQTTLKSVTTQTAVEEHTEKVAVSTKPVVVSVKNDTNHTGEKVKENTSNSTNTAGEAPDLVTGCFTPHDDDVTGAPEQTTINHTTVETSTAATNKSLAGTLPPKFFPVNVSKVFDPTNTYDERLLNHTMYHTENATDITKSITESSSTEKTVNTESKESVATSVKPAQLQSIQAAEAKKTEDTANKLVSNADEKGMPAGIIALVTAITFAVALITVYIGVIAWRRYLEYRYGHRELLVNDLEFDTNDLRHFEL